MDELSWLLTRGYAEASSLKLVGDRHNLTQRQRMAVMRSSCSDQALAQRCARLRAPEAVSNSIVAIDGYNLLITIEAALAGGVLIVGREGCCRDLASLHGTFRKVAETEPALRLIGRSLAGLQPASVLWYLDRPVSNSGRLKVMMMELAESEGWPWVVELADSPDRLLICTSYLAATADSAVLDRCGCWVNMARHVVTTSLPDRVMIPMGTAEATPA